MQNGDRKFRVVEACCYSRSAFARCAALRAAHASALSEERRGACACVVMKKMARRASPDMLTHDSAIATVMSATLSAAFLCVAYQSVTVRAYGGPPLRCLSGRLYCQLLPSFFCRRAL